MPLLVAAASDQTGRTITMLSAGLIGVAIGLTALTIWYWRFTSPRRRVSSAPVTEAARSAAEEHRVTIEDGRPTVEGPFPVEVMPIELDAPVVRLEHGPEPDPEPPPESVVDHAAARSATPDRSAGVLDSEQWAVVTRAAMDEYLDS